MVSFCCPHVVPVKDVNFDHLIPTVSSKSLHRITGHTENSPSLHRFDTDHKCDRRTDRQTDAQTMAKMREAF